MPFSTEGNRLKRNIKMPLEFDGETRSNPPFLIIIPVFCDDFRIFYSGEMPDLMLPSIRVRNPRFVCWTYRYYFMKGRFISGRERFSRDAYHSETLRSAGEDMQ